MTELLALLSVEKEGDGFMKRLAENLKKQDGAAMVVAIGAIAIMIILGTLVTFMEINSIKTVSHDFRLTEASSIAQAGVDNAISVTLANYYNIYKDGVPIDETPFPPYGGVAQALTDSTGVTVGTYQVWTRQDLVNLGNVLIKSTGTVGSDANPFSTTVLVSVKFTPPASFDYALLSGTPALDSNTTFTAGNGGRRSNTHGGANTFVTGKVNVNGNLIMNTKQLCNHGNHQGDFGAVTFLSRAGFADPVTYTRSVTGTAAGNQPTLSNTSVPFPTIDFNLFPGSAYPGKTDGVTNVNLPASGVPLGGWTRSGSTFTITADNFQNTYKSYQVVNLSSSQNDVIVKINGVCGSSDITSTIMVKGVSGGMNAGIKEIDLIGPGLSLQPTNGLAIVSGEGKVSLQGEIVVGKENAGALIYLSGENGTSSFEASSGLVMYGSLVVNGQVDIIAEGGWRHDHEGPQGGGPPWRHCGVGNSRWWGEGHITNDITLTFEGSYLTNANLPGNWWTWTAAGFTATKENYVRD